MDHRCSRLFLQFIGWGTNVTFGIFLAPLSLEFGWTRAVTSGAYTFGTILRGLLNILVGRLNDKYGPKALVMVLGSAIGGGYILLSQMSSLWHFYILFGVCVNVGMNVTFVPPATTIASWFKEKRGIATAIFLSGASFGGLIMVPLASRLITAYGWRASYVIIGIISFVVVMFWGPFLRRNPEVLGHNTPL